MTYVPFLLLREDMALLGSMYFTLLWLFRRKRLHVVVGAMSFIVFATEWCIVRFSSTPFNRGTEGLITSFLAKVSAQGLTGILLAQPRAYLLTIAAFVGVMVICVVLTRRISVYALPLFVIGLCKIGFGYVAQDRDFTRWHNHPGIVMLTGAIILQLVEGHERRKAVYGLFAGMLAASVAWFVWDQVPFLQRQIRENAAREPLVAEYRSDVLDTIAAIPPDKVTAIPMWTAIEWTLHDHPRFSFYPRGVHMSPRGIAEYMVLERANVRIRSAYNPPRTKRDIQEAHPEFALVREGRHFLLWKRVGESPESESSRRQWIELFGKESLGL